MRTMPIYQLNTWPKAPSRKIMVADDGTIMIAPIPRRSGDGRNTTTMVGSLDSPDDHLRGHRLLDVQIGCFQADVSRRRVTDASVGDLDRLGCRLCIAHDWHYSCDRFRWWSRALGPGGGIRATDE